MSSTARMTARLFKALGNETRLHILDLLLIHGDTLTVDEVVDTLIEEGIEKAQPTISAHLAILAAAGLVDYRKAGLFNYYFIVPGAFEQVRALSEKYSRQEVPI